MRLLAVSTFLLLCACGVEGPPVPPENGAKVSGEVRFGMTWGT